MYVYIYIYIYIYTYIYIYIYIYTYIHIYINYIDSTFRRRRAVPTSVIFEVLLKTELHGSAKHN